MSNPIDVASGVFAVFLFVVGWAALFNGLWTRAVVPLTLGIALIGAALILLRREPQEIP